MSRLTSSQFDINGNSFWRVFRLCIVDKCIPFTHFGPGPGLRPELVLLVLNWFGKPLFRLAVRQERLLTQLYRLFGKE